MRRRPTCPPDRHDVLFRIRADGRLMLLTRAPDLRQARATSTIEDVRIWVDGAAAAPGTVRGDFSISKQNNLLHGSDSEDSARREIALWFKPEEIVDYSIAGSDWVFGDA